MVLGLLTIAAIPTTIGIAQGISRRDECRKDAQDQAAEQLKNFTLECYCESHSVGAARALHRGRIVLKDGKVMVEPRNNDTRSGGGRRKDAEGEGAPSYEGFYIEYADNDRPKPLPMGMVTYVWDEDVGGKTLNWIYVDTHTREVKYGNRSRSKDHIVGSWSWEAGEEGGPGGVTLEGGEGAVAVETEAGWQICWEDEKGRVGVKGKSRIQISLERKMVEEGVKPSATATEPGHTTTTNTHTEMTNTKFEDHAETRGEKGGSMVKVSGGSAAPKKNQKKKEPKLEVVGQTTTRPMKK